MTDHPETNKASMSIYDSLNHTLDLLYSTPGSARGLTDFLNGLADLVNANAVSCVLFDQGNQKYAINSNTGFPPDVAKAYAEHYAAIDEWYLRGKDLTHAGDVLNGQNLLSVADLRRTEFYNDFLAPNDWIHECAAVIEANRTSLSALTLLRDSSKPDFSDTDLRIIEILVPHVQRVMRLHRNLIDLHARANSQAWALDQVSFAVILLRSDATVLQMNRAADLLGHEGFLRIKNGRLELTGSARQVLCRLLVNCKRPNVQSPTPFEVVRRLNGNPLLVSLSRTPAIGSDGAQFAVFIHDPQRQTSPPDSLLQKVYGLTPAEARLAVLLARSHTIQEIADSFHLSRHTIRTQLKAVFLKLGVHRQTQLTQLVTHLSPNLFDEGRVAHP